MIITLPCGSILRKLECDVPASVTESEWTGATQVIVGPGRQLWFANIEVPTLATEAEETEWRAFLYGLRGIVNTFNLPLACQSHAGPKPLVGAGAGNAYTLPLTGMQRDTTILDAGQYLTVPLPSGYNRLVSLAQNLVTDGTGNATAMLEQKLYETPTLGAAVESVAPFVEMRSLNRRLGMSYDQGVSGFALDLREAV
jgi:hypothetical protein